MRQWLVLAGLLLSVAVTGTQVLPEIRVVTAPTGFAGSDGQSHLAYELLISTPNALQVESLEVFGESKTPLAMYGPAELDGRTMRPGAQPDVRYNRAIQSGATAVIHVWLTLVNNQPRPTMLRHRFVLRSNDKAEIPAGDALIKVQSSNPLVLGAPIRGGTWFAHNGPGHHRSAHWGSVLVTTVRVTVPQRYAIDFIGLHANGRAVQGELKKSSNRDWVGFGAEVIAAHHGVIRDMRDGLIDNGPLAELPPPLNPTAAVTYGNYVVLEVNPNTFLHYAHLQRDSVVVKVGQRVRRGQILGLLGNSGNTNAPHLHFNVTNSPRPEESDGLPFVFASFEMLGQTTPERAVGEDQSLPNFARSPSRRREELPLDGAVLRFQ